MRKTKWIICTCCEGHGKVDNPAFSNGFTSSEWGEMTHDEQVAYKSGEYDVDCEECSGAGKVEVPNIEALTFAEKRQLVRDRSVAREARAWHREMAEMTRAEREFGC
jgi:RecJ-like exonuclease